MVAELVRRLSQAGVVSRDTLAEALIDSTTTGIHLLYALAQRHAGIVATLDGELARDKGPSVDGTPSHRLSTNPSVASRTLQATIGGAASS